MSAKHFTVLSMLVALCALVLGACTRQSKERLRADIIEINSMCPISEGFAGDLVSISYSTIANEVEMNFSVNEYFTKISTLREQRNLQLDCLRISLLNDRAKDLLEKLCNAKATLNVSYSNESTGETINFRIPPNELIGISKAAMSPIERDSISLSASIKLDNADCPREIAPAVTLTGVNLSGKNLTFSIISRDNVDKTDSEFESTIQRAILSNMLTEQIDQCRSLNVEITCIINNQTQTPISIIYR